MGELLARFHHPVGLGNDRQRIVTHLSHERALHTALRGECLERRQQPNGCLMRRPHMADLPLSIARLQPFYGHSPMFNWYGVWSDSLSS